MGKSCVAIILAIRRDILHALAGVQDPLKYEAIEGCLLLLPAASSDLMPYFPLR